jgi:hypothetical protein
LSGPSLELAAFNLGLGQQRPVYLDDDVSVYGTGDSRPQLGPAYASSSHYQQATQRPTNFLVNKPQPPDYSVDDYGEVNAIEPIQLQSTNTRYRGNQWRKKSFIVLHFDMSFSCLFATLNLFLCHMWLLLVINFGFHTVIHTPIHKTFSFIV